VSHDQRVPDRGPVRRVVKVHRNADGTSWSVRRRRGVGRRTRIAVGVVLSIGVLVLGVGPTAAAGERRTRATGTFPRVLAVHPGLVAGKGGTRILVRGRGFTSRSVVTVGGRRARVLQVRNPTAVFALVPPGIGSEVVRVVTHIGTSARNARSVLRYATRVLVVGDSLGIDLGWGFTTALDARDDLAVVDDAVGSSGLVRSNFYNWPEHLRADLAAVRPDVVVTMFGTNDEQAIETSSGLAEPGTSAWEQAYAARVRQIAAIVRRAGATLVWVGLPRMGPQTDLDPQLVADLVKVDRGVLRTLRRATFVDAWRVFTSATGAYTPYVELAPHVWVVGHSPDGTHLTTGGAMVIDAKGLAQLRHLLTHR
jgi:lysophospholipase L1-like esterase